MLWNNLLTDKLLLGPPEESQVVPFFLSQIFIFPTVSTSLAISFVLLSSVYYSYYCCIAAFDCDFLLFCFVLFCFPTPSWICLSISALEASAQLHSKRQFHCLGGFRKCVIISERLTFESAINLISGNGRATWMTHSNEVAVK